MTVRTTAVISFALLTLAVPAAAQTTPPGPDPTGLEEAKALSRQAEVDYKLAHFEVSLSEYSAAYQKYPTPGLLLNIGQCQRMLKKYEQAIFFYKGYLRDKPDASNRLVVEGLVEETTRSLEAQRADAAAAEQQRRADEQARAQLAPAVPVAPPTGTSSRGSPALRVAGVATAGVGVALVVTGIYFGLHAASDSSALTQSAAQRQTWSASDRSLYSDGTTSAQAATALYVAGGIAVATGGVLAFLGWPRKGVESTTTASVAPAHGGAALLLRGEF
jgi:tetratricopeptide (TPR) repeat protein